MHKDKSSTAFTAFSVAILVSCDLLHFRAARNSYVTKHVTLDMCDPIPSTEHLERTSFVRRGGWSSR